MRTATYNVEWFNSLFDDKGNPLIDEGWSGRQNVTRAAQWNAVGKVFQDMDADAVMIIEAPDENRKRKTLPALEHFAKHFELRARAALIGFSSDTQQEIALLYDPDVVSARHDPVGAINIEDGYAAPRFDSSFQLDLNTDAALDTVVFSKPPLEVALTHRKSGKDLRLIGVHAKSKAPHGARGAAEVMRVAIENRRKQMAQCIWIRRRVDEHLGVGEPLIVLGDFNDGPGLDEYEKLFGRSGVEIVLGEGNAPCMYDPHARMALSQRTGARPTTSRFYIAREKRYLQALLDYVMVSPDLLETKPKWRIWHPFDDPGCYHDMALREALLTASDHFPVSMDLKL
ncbi:Endonuclease/Exonuclease/phosphatase family protein [Aliiroseovarius halocynthiae]|uniref:Endonuclease n=1 Tax=Aliiroseovarius halocynthiae TaxID=985055 RepID=A0A545SM76_9RHOB|nr:endonuclease/exonuclease/phosphatase family protein [Aliiroseovarius halocynthiae]TQV66067.1 endonuclease [Aliiroseovarius halocynthiae]SMR83224.1 Endonuclease/Exonuclease/phosphatase family protein [Aliiroseovarius halocynthiae]